MVRTILQKMTLVTSDCGATRSLGIKWSSLESPRVVCPSGAVAGWLTQLEGEKAARVAQQQEAEQLLAGGQHRAAAMMLTKLLEQAPGDAELQRLIGEAERLIGAAEAAEAAAAARAEAAAVEMKALDEATSAYIESVVDQSRATTETPEMRKRREREAREAVSALLGQLGLSEHAPSCLENEMDMGVCDTLCDGTPRDGPLWAIWRGFP